MNINCSNNANLDQLQASKDALNAKMGDLAGGNINDLSANLNNLKAAADKQQADLLKAIPKPPQQPNFKQQLDALKGKTGIDLEQAKQKLNSTWGKSLPNIDINDLANKVAKPPSNLQLPTAGGFDFCKDVPNIEGTIDTATGEIASIKDKGPETTTATESANPVEDLTATVEDAASSPSKSGVLTLSFTEIHDGFRAYQKQDKADEDSYITDTKAIKNLAKIRKSRTFKKLSKYVNKKNKEDNTFGYFSFYNTEANDSEKEILSDYFRNKGIVQKIGAFRKAYKKISASFYLNSDKDDSIIQTLYDNFIKINAEYKDYSITLNTINAIYVKIDLVPIADKARNTFNQYKEVIYNMRLYTDG